MESLGRRGEGPGCRDKAEPALILQTLCPPLVPAVLAVAGAMQGEVRFAGVQRPVRRDVRYIQEERRSTRRCFCDGILQELKRMVGKRVSEIEVGGQLHALPVEEKRIELDEAEVADFARAHRAEEAVEAGRGRRLGLLPFAHHHRVTARALKQLAERDAAGEICRLIPMPPPSARYAAHKAR